MRLQFRYLVLGAFVVLGQVPAAWAQPTVNPPLPTYSSPRPQLSPYLNLLRGGDPAANYFMGVQGTYDIRALQARPPIMIEAARIDPTVDVLLDPELRDKQLPPSGHPAEYMIYNAYYNLPNQRSFMPYNPSGGRPR